MQNKAWSISILVRLRPVHLSSSQARPCTRKFSIWDRGHVQHGSLLHDIATESSRGTSLIFHSTSSNPFHNLAIEHFLLTNTHASSRILFFYTNRPCVVIGRNQNPWSECNLRSIFQASDHGPVDVVRRRSGGGTVFHDIGNLNFSVIVPNDSSFSRRKHAELVVRALQKDVFKGYASKSFTDVWVNERHDITISKKVDSQVRQFKVSGSAFKLTRGRALHHGTLLHSSPNLKKISGLLTSSGRQHIQAKGVESVRSPVSNLFDVKGAQIHELRNAITNEICEEFEHLYGEARRTEVGEADVIVSGVTSGVAELVSNAWRYGQTPRFDFKSPIVQDQQMCMSVNHGIIEECSIHALQGKNLLDIKQWSEFAPPGLANFLSEVFPSIPGGVGESSTSHGKTIGCGSHLTRAHSDGTIEVERGGNTIEQN